MNYYLLGKNKKPKGPYQLTQLRDLWKAGKIDPLVSETYDIEHAHEAIAKLENRGAIGKLVVTTHLEAPERLLHASAAATAPQLVLPVRAAATAAWSEVWYHRSFYRKAPLFRDKREGDTIGPPKGIRERGIYP